MIQLTFQVWKHKICVYATILSVYHLLDHLTIHPMATVTQNKGYVIAEGATAPMISTLIYV